MTTLVDFDKLTIGSLLITRCTGCTVLTEVQIEPFLLCLVVLLLLFTEPSSIKYHKLICTADCDDHFDVLFRPEITPITS
uniref:Uncharacterized protein n=1 Tax=Onchocerca volvulus TaxID=6282 RepID=A0A8R1Y049_ONCVO